METVPKNTDTELAAYLQRQFTRLDLLIQSNTIQRLTSLPSKPVIGKIYYFINTIPPTIASEGVCVYKSIGWSYLG